MNKQLFENFGNFVFNCLKQEEKLNIALTMEDSLFVRFNQALARQTSEVEQGIVDFLYQAQNKSYHCQIPYTRDHSLNRQRAQEVIKQCRKHVQNLPDDPFLVPITNHGESTSEFSGDLLSQEEVPQELFSQTKNHDFVGHFSQGQQIKASINCQGQNHWFSNKNFQVDYSFFTPTQKAVKGLYAGQSWNREDFKKQIYKAFLKLEILKRPEKSLKPGRYRLLCFKKRPVCSKGPSQWRKTIFPSGSSIRGLLFGVDPAI
jgi:hypothetical protein